MEEVREGKGKGGGGVTGVREAATTLALPGPKLLLRIQAARNKTKI